MSRTKLIVRGSNPKERLLSIISQCTNRNQICQHIKRYIDIIDFLKSRVKSNSDKSPMELLYLYQQNIEVPLCICGKERIYHCQGYRPTCGGKDCINITRENSKKNFCLKTYGVEFVTQLDTMKDKSKKTCLKKYGVDNITKLKEVIQKRKQNNLKKWGVTDPIMMPEFRRSDVMRIHHDNKIQSGLPNKYEYLGHIDNDMAIEYYSIKCPKNHITTISKSNLSIRKSKNQEICNLCNEYIGSMAEQEVFDYIKTIYFGNITRSDRKLIKPLEIDMVLEDIKICIEFNGDYWHSTKIIDDQYYHMDKSKSCISKGFRLLQIKERDWYEKKDEVKNKMSQFIENHPIKIDKNIYTLDLSWYDDRFLKIGNWKLIAQNKPILINVGQYLQWSGGEEIYKLL